MTPRELPGYLRPVPGPEDPGGANEATATAPSSPALEAEKTGLIPPMSPGHSGAFITDAIVDLGYATREQVDQAIAQSRTAERPPEHVLLDQRAINSEQLARATAERYGLDFVDLNVYTVDMGAANLISVKSARRHQALPVGYAGEASFNVSGQVGANGAVTVRVSRGSQSATGTGRMSSSDGTGRWATASGECSGTWSAERRS